MIEARNDSPTRRIVTGYQGSKYVVELRQDEIVVRPKGARTGGPAEVSITPSALHDKLILGRERAEHATPTRRRRVKRGLIV